MSFESNSLLTWAHHIVNASMFSLMLLGSIACAAQTEPCPVFPEPARNGLIQYVQKKYHLRPEAGPRLAEEAAVGSTCYRKLRFESDSASVAFSLTLYVSPDGRFLATDMMDTHVDPVAEEKRLNQETAVHLSEGARFYSGPPDAPVTVVIFSDFQCPFCKSAAALVNKEQETAEGKRVRFIFRQFPLGMHAWARNAAESAVCAGFQSENAFWRFHDYIFENQTTLNAKNLAQEMEKPAQGIPNFDLASYRTCVADQMSAGLVTRDIALGTANHVRGTPTIFVNGRPLSAAKDQQALHAAILEALTDGRTKNDVPIAAATTSR